MHWISPRDSAGFSILAASREPSADPAPTSVCSSSIKMIRFRFSTSSFMIVFNRSSNWPRYFVPATMREMSRARIFLSRSGGGTWPFTILWARPSTMAVLPTPGSPMSTGLFLVLRQRIWIIRSISVSLPINGSSASIAGSLRQVPGKLDQAQRLLRPGLGACFSDEPRLNSSRTILGRNPCSLRISAATDFSSRSSPRRMCSVPMCL